MRYLAAATLVALAVAIAVRDSNAGPALNTIASKCTGADPCLACSNCHRCGHCKKGGTCGTCKPKKKGERALAYLADPLCP